MFFPARRAYLRGCGILGTEKFNGVYGQIPQKFNVVPKSKWKEKVSRGAFEDLNKMDLL